MIDMTDVPILTLDVHDVEKTAGRSAALPFPGLDLV